MAERKKEHMNELCGNIVCSMVDCASLQGAENENAQQRKKERKRERRELLLQQQEERAKLEAEVAEQSRLTQAAERKAHNFELMVERLQRENEELQEKVDEQKEMREKFGAYVKKVRDYETEVANLKDRVADLLGQVDDTKALRKALEQEEEAHKETLAGQKKKLDGIWKRKTEPYGVRKGDPSYFKKGANSPMWRDGVK